MPFSIVNYHFLCSQRLINSNCWQCGAEILFSAVY